MKTITLIFALLVLSSCNDALRTRIGKCKSANNQLVICGTTDALKSEEYRKTYIAEITTSIVVGQSQIILKDSVKDSDHDNELTCDLEISANKQFNYSIENGILFLRDGLSTLSFTRTTGLSSEGLIGTWIMQEKTSKQLTITEVVFRDLEELRITKTCKIK